MKSLAIFALSVLGASAIRLENATTPTNIGSEANPTGGVVALKPNNANRVPQAPLEELKKSRVIAIRHGQTYANVANKEEGEKTSAVSRWLVDTTLTEQGIKTSESTGPLAAGLDFQVIMVSPLRRTIQTAFHTFKKTPNFEKMPVILTPMARESILEVGDVPLNIDKVLAEFEGMFPQGFDKTLLQKYED